MTRTRRSTRLLSVKALPFAVLLLVFLLLSFTAGAFDALADGGASGSDVRYTNPDSGHRVVVLDDCDLLSAEEEERLVSRMQPITEYGDVAFWSTDEPASEEVEQARQKRKSLFEYSSATIFVINMKTRRLAIQSYGVLYETIDDSRARSIADNASAPAKKGNYFDAADLCYSEITDLVQGFDIPEPMKQTGYAMLAVIIAFTVVLIAAFSARFNPLRAEPDGIEGLRGVGVYNKLGKRVVVKEVEFRPSSGGGGGGGCGGGGGGGCGGGGGAGF